MLPPIIQQYQHQIRRICEQFGVQTLEVFGSATGARFDPDLSDLDFIVRFVHERPEGYADRFLGLAEALEQLFGKRVDLLTERCIRNPYFRKTVDASRTTIYERGRAEVAV
jgi:predicted nucleotidyltransferase